MKTLYIVNVPSHSPVSQLSKTITENIVSCWNFYAQYGQTKFNNRLKPYADSYCRKGVKKLMQQHADTILVANTFPLNSDLDYFYEEAKQNGYQVSALVMEKGQGFFEHKAAALGCDKQHYSLVS